MWDGVIFLCNNILLLVIATKLSWFVIHFYTLNTADLSYFMAESVQHQIYLRWHILHMYTYEIYTELMKLTRNEPPQFRMYFTPKLENKRVHYYIVTNHLQHGQLQHLRLDRSDVRKVIQQGWPMPTTRVLPKF